MLSNASTKGGATLKIPLAEHFHSIMGEGYWSGTPMHFLRFPGCNVGRALNPERRDLPILSTGAPAVECTTYDGRHFWCDTDYARHLELELEVLVRETYEYHVCFTGGEPLIHQNKEWFKTLVRVYNDRLTTVHLETSGTIVPALAYDWITVSPKLHWNALAVRKANQLKLLVDQDFDYAKAEEVIKACTPSCLVYVSPIFDPNELVKENVTTALELLKAHPRWRLSVQVHKWIGVR